MYKPIQFLFPSSGDTYIVHDFTSQEQKKKNSITHQKKKKKIVKYTLMLKDHIDSCVGNPPKNCTSITNPY